MTLTVKATKMAMVTAMATAMATAKTMMAKVKTMAMARWKNFEVHIGLCDKNSCQLSNTYAGSYIHKNICFNVGTGIKNFEVSIRLYDEN